MKIQFEFSEDQLKIINEALIRLPYASVAALIFDINNQIKGRPLHERNGHLLLMMTEYHHIVLTHG